MVVLQVQDLDGAAVGELPGGGVALPHLVGEVGLKTNKGAARPLVRLRNDEAAALEDPPDGGGRGQLRDSALEIEEDGLGPGIEAGLAQLVTELDDFSFDVSPGFVRQDLGRRERGSRAA